MPTQEHDSWLSALGVDVDKVRNWVNKEVDDVKDDVDKAENWAKDEVQKGVDWATTEANKAVDAVKKGIDTVKTEAGKAVGAVKKGTDALKMKALGDQSGKPVPRSMEGDCKPEHGYVPGPKNHLLCSTHGHVIDTDQRMIIAASVADYLKAGAAGIVKKTEDAGAGLLKKAEAAGADVAQKVEDAAKQAAGAATDAIGAKPADRPVSVPAPQNPFDLPSVQLECENLAIEPLRLLAVSTANAAFSEYLAAVQQARADYLKKAELKEKENEAQIAILLAIVCLPLGPATEAAGAAIAGDQIRSKLLGAIASNGPRLAKVAGVADKDLQIALTNEVYEKAASDALARLASKFDGTKAQKAVEKGLDKLKEIGAKIFAQDSREGCAVAYLDALADSAGASMKGTLLPAIVSAATYDELLGFYNSARAGSQSVYVKQINDQVDHFLDQFADALIARRKGLDGRSTKLDLIVKMDAYGRIRYAQVRHHLPADPILSAEDYYDFKAWVSRDGERIAEQMNPPLIDPKKIAGHLPDPGPDPA